MDHHSRLGLTIIEFVAAVAILSVALIPVLRLFPNEVNITDTDKTRSILLYLAQKKIDETIRELQIDYEATLTTSGDFSSEGFADNRFTISTSDAVANLLKNVTITVWYDEDGDTSQDDAETDVTLDTRVAKREL